MNYLEYQEYQDYLCHHGVKGMKWGVRRDNRSGGNGPLARIKKRNAQKLADKVAKEKQALIDDASYVTAKAFPGQKTMGVTGFYSQKRNGKIYTAYHIVDDMGDVKLSYFNTSAGPKIVAAGKDYVDKNIDLNKHFKNVKDIDIEYDVYKSSTSDKTKRKATDSINAKFQKKYDAAVKAGKSDLDIELIELEWMEALDELEN